MPLLRRFGGCKFKRQGLQEPVKDGWAPKRLSIAKISETMTNLVTVSLLANSRVQGHLLPSML